MTLCRLTFSCLRLNSTASNLNPTLLNFTLLYLFDQWLQISLRISCANWKKHLLSNSSYRLSRIFYVVKDVIQINSSLNLSLHFLSSTTSSSKDWPALIIFENWMMKLQPLRSTSKVWVKFKPPTINCNVWINNSFKKCSLKNWLRYFFEF